MILGVLDRGRQGTELKQDLLRAVARQARERQGTQPMIWADRHLAICLAPRQIETLDESPQPCLNEGQTIVVIWEGKIYNLAEITRSLRLGHKLRTACSGETLAYLYETYQEGFLDRVNGRFAIALWDATNQKLILGRDRLGIEPLFYHHDGERLIFSSSVRGLLSTGWVRKELNDEAVLQYFLYCYNPGDDTFLRNIYKLPAGRLLSADGPGLSIKRYWRLSFAEAEEKTEAQYREEIPALVEDAIRIRLEPHRPPGAFLSGGTDSSTIVALTSKISKAPLRTFSFRCEGRSYDESHYARLVAHRYGTQHSEIPYHPDHLTLISKAVEAMDEPFCDIGIEIGTYLLGRAAEGQVSYVLSGEGGDELFGGHPVYIADKLASVVDRVPRLLMYPLTWASQRIPDSDQKKNIQVKLKRFAYSLSFPSQLLSHRWRIHYSPQELWTLCTPDFIEHCDMHKLFDPMLKYTQEADGGDQLSRSLYSDYQTLVNFYLRRLGLLGACAIESRLPLLDHRLVEYAAKIPSQLKIRGLSDTKYIYKKILEGILPGEILYDRPKLGHSVPMKNWLRECPWVKEWIVDVLCDGSFKARGFFRAGSVERMVDEHVRRTHNHSHRLWGLMVLELWLRNCLDEASG